MRDVAVLTVFAIVIGGCISQPSPWLPSNDKDATSDVAGVDARNEPDRLNPPDGGDSTREPDFADIHATDDTSEIAQPEDIVPADVVAHDEGCLPDCIDRICGPDGCGGSCGECGAYKGCHPNGQLCVGRFKSVSSGPFWMGCNQAMDEECFGDEHPYHQVYLDDYFVQATEVTVQHWQDCIDHGGPCNKLTDSDCTVGSTTYGKASKEQHPITCVKWDQARQYCQWIDADLCTEARWEKAARGGCEMYDDCKAESRKYPWGNIWPDSCDDDLAIYSDCKCDGWCCPVLSATSGVSLYGIVAMIGNVSEWTLDYYQSDYYCDGHDAISDKECSPEAPWPDYPEAWSNPQGPPEGNARVTKGGNYLLATWEQNRIAMRFGVIPTYSYHYLGFRCCRGD
jgi:formylglycine-generating enzyme required for sulfatase activity